MKFFKYTIFATVPIIIFLSAVLLLAFDYDWYNQEFEKLNVFQSVSADRVRAQTQNLFSYLNGRALLNPEFYTTREVSHLTDVKNLVVAIKIIDSVAIIIFGLQLWLIAKKFGLAKLLKILVSAGLASLGFYLFLIILALTGFEPVFTLFHRLVFQNDFWQLDPAVDKLIVIFPPELFLALISRIIIVSIGISIVCLMFFASFRVIFLSISKNNN